MIWIFDDFKGFLVGLASKKPLNTICFFDGFVQIVFFQKVRPRDQTSLVFGAQHGPESELWSDISGPKIDKNSGSKKRGSKIEKSELKKQIPILDWSFLGDILDPRVLGNEHCL